MGRTRMLAGLVLLMQPLWLTPALAEIYHYVDQHGRKIYVDRQSQIPPQYRARTQTLKEESETLTPAQQVRRAQHLEQLQAQQGIQGEIAAIDAQLAALEQPARVSGNSVRVPVELRYLGQRRTVQLVVDTGASRTLLHKGAIGRLGGLLRPAGQAQVVGGARIPTSRLSVDGLSFGPVEQGAMELMVIEPSQPLDYDGLLGMDILGQLKYEIDLPRQRVIWHADRYRELQRTRQALQARAEGGEPQP